MKHVNAEDVLPEKLLTELQKHCGGYLYVPVTGEARGSRRADVLRLGRRGQSIWAIARKVGLTERRVRQILAEGRRK